MNNNKTKSRGVGRRAKRGVGVIIGGVILAAILLTSVFAFYITILNNDKAKTSYEIQSQQENRDKGTETYIVDREPTIAAGSVVVHVNNTSSIPMVASKALVYCSSDGCATPGKPIDEVTLSTVLNPGETLTTNLGNGLMTDVDDTYTITVISERGNIISSTICTLQADGTCLEDSDGSLIGGICIECEVTEGIIQGTGTVVLDYKSFGAIYPELASRAGINQQGWLVKTGTTYNNVTGYPAFDVLFETPTVYVESMRNLDPVEEDLLLSKATGLLTNQGTVPPGLQQFEFICNSTKSYDVNGVITGGSFAGYSETSNPTIIPPTPLDAERSEGWREVYFCSATMGGGTANYEPDHVNNQLNGIIMVVRGSFIPSYSDYGQTIPYQASMPGTTNFGTFTACIRTNTGLGTACPSPTSVCDGACATTTHRLVYSATKSEMCEGGPGCTGPKVVQIRVNQNVPVTVTWIYPNGTSTVLKRADTDAPIVFQSLTSNYVTGGVKLPTDLTCTGTNPQDYSIKVADQYDSQGRRDVHYMTFRMTCP